jgi:hypothetical protein
MNNKTIGRLAAALAVMVLLLSACKSDKPSEKAPEVPTVQAPRFDRDSAYSFVAQQVAFGPVYPTQRRTGLVKTGMLSASMPTALP